MTTTTSSLPHEAERPLRPALLRGWKGHCPACGEARMMAGYLKVRPECPSCGEELHHQRADDGPAFLTVLIVGKVTMAVYLTVFMAFQPEPWVMIALCWTLALGMALFLLPRLKGAFVALQWANRMHGFGRPGQTE
ncbi:MAG TPA: DUF983 domain-containing protein [Paracoccus sp.]|nr:DUF983 domain-containing protein [Paracoccus sp. (in: a-proteobacteria)]